jgi:hypothetical protein
MNSRIQGSVRILVGLFAITAAAKEAAAQPAPAPSAAPAPEPTPAPAAVPAPPPPVEVAPPVVLPPPPPPPPVVVEIVQAPPPPPPAPSQLKIEGAAGSIRFGLLAQPQYEAVGASNANGYSQNIYLRRIRLLVGGTLFDKFEYFVETDDPNMFKAAADGTKGSPGMNIQDAFVTYRALGDLLKVDAGYMLPPLAHNAVQGAATLYGWDYFANTFRHTNVFGSAADPIGRDLGAELRGLLFNGRLEYRAGVFQGRRNPPIAAVPVTMTAAEVQSRNSFRVAGRLQLNIFDPETGFFYGGTYLGTKKILSIGGSYDYQHSPNGSYRYWALDGIVDMPLGPGGVTGQVNYAHWNGGDLVNLPLQKAIMAEAGYRFAAIHLSPILRFEKRWETGQDETRFAGGLALWCYGHNSNLKAFYSRIYPEDLPTLHAFNQFNVQWQVYFF